MRYRLSFVVVSLLALLLSGALADHALAVDCQPIPAGSPYCVNTPLATFWQGNGGVPVFGFPISQLRPELNRDTRSIIATQWFERTRFELHPENPPAYGVLLGRIGAELLQAQGRNWLTEPSTNNPLGGSCMHFAATNRDVCGPFLAYWLGHGLHNPLLDPYHRSLQLFGLPLTGVKHETNWDGDTVLTQWFERARFELHPELGNIVLLGRVGREGIGSLALPVPPPPTPSPTSMPTLTATPTLPTPTATPKAR